ncbi:MAG: hypothetical protein ABJA35_08030, partial [Parafilimonas sp.]
SQTIALKCNFLYACACTSSKKNIQQVIEIIFFMMMKVGRNFLLSAVVLRGIVPCVAHLY